MLAVLWLISLAICAFSQELSLTLQAVCSASECPESIPVFPIRMDTFTKQPVVSGHMHNLKGKLRLKDFKKQMQCIEKDEFDYNSGSESLLRSIPPTKEIVELMCAFGEKVCKPWTRCQAQRTEYLTKNNSFPSKFQARGLNGFSSFKMFRVMKGGLFYDWPWGIDRLNYTEHHKFMELNAVVGLMKLVLDKVSDMPDSVFFAGGEAPALPYDFPFPVFSHASSLTHVDIPWPWMESFKAARQLYQSTLKANGSFALDERTVEASRQQWQRKLSKAAFFAGYDNGRLILFDAARRYPDMFDAAFGFTPEGIQSWNPQSRMDVLTDAMKPTITQEQIRNASTWNQSGYAVHLMSLIPRRSYDPTKYKYVIVPMGINSESTSGRLADLLATSGAVILLQRSHLSYHYSAHLKPWIHYVPLTFSGADVVKKVRWLIEHDDLARQIAENGRAFAQSYLRLEDYYCYAANALEMVAEIEKGSDALHPFSPRPIGPVRHAFRHVNASETGKEQFIDP